MFIYALIAMALSLIGGIVGYKLGMRRIYNLMSVIEDMSGLSLMLCIHTQGEGEMRIVGGGTYFEFNNRRELLGKLIDISQTLSINEKHNPGEGLWDQWDQGG